MREASKGPAPKKLPKSITDVAKKVAAKQAPPSQPVWAGPGGEGANGGVTQSLIGRYLCDRERFRLQYMDGWKAVDTFNPRLEFGTMWHVCEEALAGFAPDDQVGCLEWQPILLDHCQALARKYRDQQAQVDHWYGICKVLFPMYVEHWAKHPDVTNRQPLCQEVPFDVPYQLPSGRIARLRGKWDSVDLIGEPHPPGRNNPHHDHKECRFCRNPARVYIQENKTKSQVNQDKIVRQLKFDLQTMLYTVALREQFDNQGNGAGLLKPVCRDVGSSNVIAGVRYNVIRRSAHKSIGSMVNKIEEDREAGRINEWFARWKVDISKTDIDIFKLQCLDPVLENMLDDYEWWYFCASHKEGLTERAVSPFSPIFKTDRHQLFPDHWPRHYRYPFGIYNPLEEGGSSELDNLMDTGSTLGLERATNLFPELQEEV